MNYLEKLKDPRWQRKRLDILNRDSFTCKLCGDKKTTLHVHHKTYKKGKEPWDYKDENFITLCQHCHALTESEFGHKYDPDLQIMSATKFTRIGEANVLLFVMRNDESVGFFKCNSSAGTVEQVIEFNPIAFTSIVNNYQNRVSAR